MTLWSELLVAERRRDATYEAHVPHRLRYLDRYCIPTYDIATVPAKKRKTVRLRDRNGIAGEWVAIRNTTTLTIADTFKPTSTEDMAMVVYNSDTGEWVQLWGYSTHLYTFGPFKIGSAGSGARWVGGANLLRQPKHDRGEWRGAGELIDYRRWNGNADGAMGASLGPAARGVTYDELVGCIESGDPLPRCLPVYIPNTSGAVCPAGQQENPRIEPDGCPGGQAWAYPSTESLRKRWVDGRKWRTDFDHDAALVFARSASTDGRGCVAAASTPPFSDPGFFTDRMPVRMPDDMLAGMPGEESPVAYAPLVGYRYRERIGSDWGLYDDVRLS